MKKRILMTIFALVAIVSVYALTVIMELSCATVPVTYIGARPTEIQIILDFLFFEYALCGRWW